MYLRTYFDQFSVLILTYIVSLLGVTYQFTPTPNNDVLLTVSQYGQVSGYSIPALNPQTPDQRTNIFLGIPYAKRPKDFTDKTQFRFQKPVPEPRWDGILDGKNWPPACPQMTWFGRQTIPGFNRMDEDCLFLNVFAPNYTRNAIPPSCTEKGSVLYPVMVFIHGGGYVMGTAQQWPPVFLVERNVVVVTFNYRLGALGFLSTGTKDSVGNYGMWDQVAALEFVKDNIQCFGGDPDKVTLFGHSTGAASVGLHILSPSTGHVSTQRLFHQAIMMSGCDRNEWALIRQTWHAQEYAQQLAMLLNCPSNDNYQMIRCMRMQKTWQEVANASARVQLMEGHLGSPWGPVVDGFIEGTYLAFLPNDPKTLREELNFPTMRVMAGLVKDEGSWFIPDLPTLPDGITLTEFEQIIREFLEDRGSTNIVESMEAMKFQYTYWPDPLDMLHKRQMLTDLMSDYMFGTGVNEVLQHNSVKNRTGTFGYIFDYKSYMDYMPSWRGVAHGQDLQYVFGFPFFDESYQKQFQVTPRQTYSYGDHDTSKMMMAMFTSFASFGQPTAISYHNQEEFAHVTWQPFNADKDIRSNSILVIANQSRSHMVDNYRLSYYGFWRETMGLENVHDTGKAAITDPEDEFKIATYCLVAALILLVIMIITFTIMYCTNKRAANDPFSSTATPHGSKAGTLADLRLSRGSLASREYYI